MTREAIESLQEAEYSSQALQRPGDFSNSGALSDSVEDADLHASTPEYAARFGGSVGEWMLAVQSEALLTLSRSDCTSVLDIGGGHGQTAIPLIRAGRSVTVLGSSPGAAQQLQQFIDTGVVSFQVGNLIAPPYRDREFDSVISFRLMSHCTAWKTLIAEMCRIAEQDVIIDYPVWFSANILAPLSFSIKRKLEGNTRTFRIFSSAEICSEFGKHGFVLERRIKQFVLPMALHRALKSVGLSRSFEEIGRRLGLTWLFGSPVVARFVRRDRQHGAPAPSVKYRRGRDGLDTP